jgi:hypothetical protein
MRMKKLLLAVVCLMLVAGLLNVVTATGKFDSIVTAADVEQATGLTGLKLVPRQKAVHGITENKLLTGDINFVGADNQPVIAIQFRPSFAFDQFKEDSGFIKAAVKGIGDEAYTGPSFDPQTSVNFVKGDYYVAVATHIDPKDRHKTVLPIDKVIAVAKVVAARMQ